MKSGKVGSWRDITPELCWLKHTQKQGISATPFWHVRKTYQTDFSYFRPYYALLQAEVLSGVQKGFYWVLFVILGSLVENFESF